jgi:hypothetical protein
MKCAKTMLLLTLVVAMVQGIAMSQTHTDTVMMVKVPFEFMAGSRFVPAGRCAVEFLSTGNPTTLVIRNVAARVSLISPALSGETKKVATDYTMVFHKYGDRYFLSALRVAGSRNFYRIPESKAERELRAQNVSATDEILLASKE